MSDPGIVDKDVDPAAKAVNCLHDLLVIGNITRVRKDIANGKIYLSCCRCAVAGVDTMNCGTLFCKELNDGFANSARTAGNDRSFVLQAKHLHVSVKIINYKLTPRFHGIK